MFTCLKNIFSYKFNLFWTRTFFLYLFPFSRSGVIFTQLHFLRKVQMISISYSVCLQKAFTTLCYITPQLFGRYQTGRISLLASLLHGQVDPQGIRVTTRLSLLNFLVKSTELSTKLERFVRKLYFALFYPGRGHEHSIYRTAITDLT